MNSALVSSQQFVVLSHCPGRRCSRARLLWRVPVVLTVLALLGPQGQISKLSPAQDTVPEPAQFDFS
jgi:hypothetical protein